MKEKHDLLTLLLAIMDLNILSFFLRIKFSVNNENFAFSLISRLIIVISSNLIPRARRMSSPSRRTMICAAPSGGTRCLQREIGFLVFPTDF